MKCPHCGKRIDAAATLGAKGGKASAQGMTPEQRKERAKTASEARWKKS